ncbi:hypothetical protein Rhe02_81490 [Rhizocola hellebori]|uniref:Uncharacterized protein n=1 Tax=Rhizocola hellebori TaxID=1392758 RepID=A0A8J3QHF6_9ACTN|nr:hypothetical protein [Rhizocola hellebori]GIH10082.1 hypothetical protein Rhe02_81490 [Rhizocola hellebori]
MRRPKGPSLLRVVPEGEAPEVTAWHAQAHDVVMRIRQRLEDERQPIEVREAFAELMHQTVEVRRAQARLAAVNARYADLMQEFGLVEPEVIAGSPLERTRSASGRDHDCGRDVCEPVRPCPSWCRQCVPADRGDCALAAGAAFHRQVVGTVSASGIETPSQRYYVAVSVEQFVCFDNPSASEPPAIQMRAGRDPEPVVDLAEAAELDELSIQIMAAMHLSGRGQSMEISLSDEQVEELFGLIRQAREVLADTREE